MLPAEVPAWLKEKAEQVRPYNPGAAVAFEEAAETLTGALQAVGMDPLTLEEAELEGGYSVRHLKRLLKEGRVPNAGSPGAPRILRCNVPRKPGYAVVGPEEVDHTSTMMPSSRRQIAQAVLARE